MYDSLITREIIQENLETNNWCFFDCRFELNNPEKKLLEFKNSHLPKAVYVNLERDLSGSHISGKSGRHPLPEIMNLKKKFSLWGIDSSVQVVLYDDFGGAHAARFWWILRWLGHERVAVMDGGWPLWIKENRPVSCDIFSPKTRVFHTNPNEDMYVSSEKVLEYCLKGGNCILDARSKKRYSGEIEPFDSVAGHIPSAVSAPHTMNLDENGNWKSKTELRKIYTRLLQNCPVNKAVTYCGSGITACHNILSMYYAGLGISKIFPGSWSEWIIDPSRPVERG